MFIKNIEFKLKNLLFLLIFLINSNLLFSIDFQNQTKIENTSKIIQITEINFLNNEFIEIYSNIKLNFSNSLFLDSSNKSEKLFQLNNPNSNIYIIASNNFLKNINKNISNLNDLDDLDYNLIINNKSNLGYYGLKNNGENFKILNIFFKNKKDNPINLTNLSNFNNLNNFNKIDIIWHKKRDYEFKENETLNFILNLNNTIQNINNLNQKNQFEFIYNNTIGNISINLNYFKINLTQNNTTKNNSENISNLGLNLEHTSNPNINYSIKIITDKILFNKRIEYWFELSDEIKNMDYKIEYWIEERNYITNKNIVDIIKSKKNTTNTNKKYYTPNFESPKILILKANLILNNSIKNTTNKTIFFFPEINEQKYNSSIEIINQDEIKSRLTKELELKIYRNETRKKIVNIYLNNKKINSIQIQKNTEILTKINLNDLNYSTKNSIKIIGLNITKYIIINKTELNQNETKMNTSFFYEENLINKSLNQKKYFKINNLTYNKTKIQFEINTNYQKLNLTCYILNKKTKISTLYNLFFQKDLSNLNISLDLNKTKLEKITNELKRIKLKLLCKYKKPENKNFIYSSLEFNYSINKINNNSLNKSNLYNLKNNTNNFKPIRKIENTSNKIKTNQSKLNISLLKFDLNQGSNLLNSFEYSNQINPYIQNQGEINSGINQEVIYKSKNEKLKENTPLIILAGTLMIFIPMLILW